jgi:DNA polymerase-3 subunit epsilon
MMAQVWDLEIVECQSAIEAALVESDEIKRLNPPYNVSLKAGNRSLLYYNRALTEESLEPSSEFCVGPFRRFNSIEHLRIFAGGLTDDLIANVFYEPIERKLLEEGYALFEEKYGSLDGKPVRDHVAFGVRLLRKQGRDENDDEAVDVDDEVNVDVNVANVDSLSPEDILEKIERLYARAASTYLRAKELTRLLWSDVRWSEKGELKSLCVRGGQLVSDPALRLDLGVAPWQGLAISDYDRMSVLLMEVSKVDHEIEAVR